MWAVVNSAGVRTSSSARAVGARRSTRAVTVRPGGRAWCAWSRWQCWWSWLSFGLRAVRCGGGSGVAARGIPAGGAGGVTGAGGCCGRRCTAPTATSSTANAIRDRVSGRTRVAIRPPSRLPIAAAAVKTPMTAQSMAMPCPARAASAVALLIAMTSSEVPTATGIGKPRARTSAGTTAKPPPTPKNPVSSPTAVAVNDAPCGAGAGAHEAGGERDDRQSNASVLQCRRRRRPCRLAGEHERRDGQHQHGEPGEQHGRGHAGRQVRAVQDPAAPRAPKSRPWATRTRPARAWATIPISEVTPTMISDPVVAAPGVLPQHVDQGRHGQDRPAAAERAQAQPDQQPDGNGKDKHEKRFSVQVGVDPSVWCRRGDAPGPG